jgi:UDP-glucose 4-epimerase
MPSLSEFQGAPVLVTGGAGFVGSRITLHLAEAGAHVTVLDDFSTGDATLLPKSPQVEVVKGSVCDPAAVRAAMRGRRFVVHCAARNIIASTANPHEDFATNVGGTLEVLLAARELRPQRIVYSSSASIYGNPVHLPISEDDPPSTLSPYAVSKLAAENYCLAFYESYGVAVSMVRYSNVYGPHQSPANPYCGVVAKFFDAAMRGEPLRLHGDGEQTRDYTFIDDTVAATLAAVLSPRAEGAVFNVATGFETSARRLAELVVGVTGSRSAIETIERRDIDNIRRRVLSIERARRVLRWSPSVTLAEGLRRTHAWLRERAAR